MPPPRLHRLQATVLGLAAFLPLTVHAQPPAVDRIGGLIAELNRVHRPETVALSPDGEYVAWTVAGAHGMELHLTGIAPPGTAQDGAWDRILSPDSIGDVTNSRPGLCSAHHPAWSPDGTRLAFLSNCDELRDQHAAEGWKKTAQDNLFVWTLSVNGMSQLSHLHGAVSAIQWSPDGRSIGFLYVANATRRAGALDAMKPWSGVIGEDNVEVQRVAAVSANGRNATGSGSTWLVPRDVRSGVWLTPPNLHAYEFTWAPDSESIAFVAAPPPGENNWWIAQLYEMGLGPLTAWCGQPAAGPPGDQTGGQAALCSYNGPLTETPRVLVDPAKSTGPLHGLQIAVPRFSPDGRQIAFIGGLMSDQGSVGGDIYLVSASGAKSEPRDIMPDRASSPAWIKWLSNSHLLVSEHAGGSTRITTLDTATGRDVPGSSLTLDESLIAGIDEMSLAISHDGATIAATRQSFAHPPEVWVGPLKDMRQLTHLNDALKPAWGDAKSIDYTNGGRKLQGWLLYPAGWSPAAAGNPSADPAASNKKYPLIVSVHGGPSSAVTPHWPGAAYGGVPFSALGYFVFLPNPRGSFGQGEAFVQANVRDFGHGDLSDILAGMDAIERRFPIDPHREGLTGWSYGGYMTMFAVTQTTRFRAAVAGAGIANWQSYYGENSIDQWMLPFFGASVYDDPKVYARSSPIEFIRNVKTPTLLVVGDRDGECPAPQSFEFWHALRDLGIRTELVVYPDEGHHFVSPEHQRDVLRRALDWFAQQMPPA